MWHKATHKRKVKGILLRHLYILALSHKFMILNPEEFKAIEKHLEQFEEKREETISKSRDIIKTSKLIIYALQRDDLSTATKHIEVIKKQIKALSQQKYDTNMDVVALQEYVEAVTFYHFVKEKKIPTRKQLNVSAEAYLLGLCDLTGELVRKAVNAVINKKPKEALQCKELCEEIYGQFLQFNLRNGELRKKADSIKWNLQKLESIIYDMHMKRV